MKKKYYIYHIPGKKIGVSSNLHNRVTKAQGYLPHEYEILEETDDIFRVSKREIELQEQYGYSIDKTLYLNIFKSYNTNNTIASMIKSTEQTSTLPWSKLNMMENLIKNLGFTWETPYGNFEIGAKTIEWINENSYKSQFDSDKSYIYNKAYGERFIDKDNAKNNIDVNTFDKIRDWAEERGIYTKGDVKTQYVKLGEEFGELGQSILKNDKDGIVDAIGDCVVVLTNLAHLAGFQIEFCIDSAYNEIKSRQGKMIDGTFVKMTKETL